MWFPKKKKNWILGESKYAKSVMDRSFRLGRRHAALIRGRTDKFKAEWWKKFLNEILDVLLPYVASYTGTYIQAI